MEVKKYSWCEARQRFDSSCCQGVQNYKSQLLLIEKNFLVSILFETEEKAASEENKQQDLTNDKLLVEVKGFFCYTKFENSRKRS